MAENINSMIVQILEHFYTTKYLPTPKNIISTDLLKTSDVS